MILAQYRFYILLGIAALLSWWLVQIIEKKQTVETIVAEKGADYFSNDYVKTEMNVAGTPINDLVAAHMFHLNSDDTTHLQKPVMTLYSNEVSPWVIDADAGILSADGDQLRLAGKVHIHREAATGVRPLTVNTSNMRVRLPDNFAETDEWAEIISPPDRTTGVGMQVTFVDPVRLKLLAKVKGRYVFK